jgi:hypothetical protein
MNDCIGVAGSEIECVGGGDWSGRTACRPSRKGRVGLADARRVNDVRGQIDAAIPALLGIDDDDLAGRPGQPR